MTESTSDNRSVYRLRWMGYGLLIFAFLDSVSLLVPPRFTNPEWELQTIGGLVERVVVPLLGFALVFFGEFYDRLGLERWVLRALSWVCLGLAVLFLLLIPLGVVNTVRLDGAQQQDVTVKVENQMKQLQKLEEQLNQSKPEDIKTLGAQLGNLGIQVEAQKPEELKATIVTRINKVRADVETQSKAARSGQRTALFKNSFRWNLGALIAAVLFGSLWRSTDWARKAGD
jgi:hypothetical protein